MKEFKTKPKFYSYVREKQKVKVGVTQLKKEDGTRTDNDETAAQGTEQVFSVCTPLNQMATCTFESTTHHSSTVEDTAPSFLI